MIEIIKDKMVKQKHTFLEKLKCNEIMFSDKGCNCITEKFPYVVDEPSSNQQETDTKLLLHVKHALCARPEKTSVYQISTQ